MRNYTFFFLTITDKTLYMAPVDPVTLFRRFLMLL